MANTYFGSCWVSTFTGTSFLIMILSLGHMIGGGVVLQTMKNDYNYNYGRPPNYNITAEDQKTDLNITVYTYNVVMVILSGIWLFCGALGCLCCLELDRCGWLFQKVEPPPENACTMCFFLVLFEPMIGIIYGAIIFSTAKDLEGTQYTLFMGVFFGCIVLAGLSFFPLCCEGTKMLCDECDEHPDWCKSNCSCTCNNNEKSRVTHISNRQTDNNSSPQRIEVQLEPVTIITTLEQQNHKSLPPPSAPPYVTYDPNSVNVTVSVIDEQEQKNKSFTGDIGMCKICFNYKPLMVLIPCCHIQFCNECLITLKSHDPNFVCPTCRTPISSIHKPYM